MKRVVFAVLAGILVCSFAVGPTLAQEIGFNGVGGRLSFVDPESPIGSTVGFGGHADLGEIIQNLRLIPSLEFWSKSSVTQVAINGDVRYYFPTQSEVDFFGGGGLVIAFNSIDLGPFGDASDSAIGVAFLGGADFPLSENVVGTAEVKFVASDINALRITGGITYLLGK